MRAILGNLKSSWKAVCVIIALLIVQAYCDLSLPTYMSNIVDIGIQQNGIADAVPEQLDSASMDTVKLFLSTKQVQQLQSAYTETDGIYTLNNNLTDTRRTALSDTLRKPFALLYQLSNAEESPYSMEQLLGAVQSGQMDAAQVKQMTAQALEAMDNVPETTQLQMAVMFIQQQYETLGVDLGHMRNSYLLQTGAKMLGLAALGLLMAILVSLIASRVGAGVGKSLREQVFERVLSFSHAEMNQFSTASLITRSTNDIQQVQMVSVMLLRMVVYAPICALGGIIKVLNTHTGMEWIIVVAVICIVGSLSILISIATPKFKMMQQLIDRMNLISREILTGIMPIRAFSREKQEEKRFDGANNDLMRTQLFTNRVMTFLMPIMMFVMNGITVLIVWAGARGIDAGSLQVGDLMAFINYTMMIVMGFMMMTMISIMLPRAGVAANRINEVINTQPTINDRTDAKDASAIADGTVCFDDVTFCFPGADHPVLQNISFTAEPGKTTAIIGSTGSGKSTILNLIPRFYDVTSGAVRVGGTDVRELTQHSLRDQLGYVPQKGILFSGTIASNVKFSDENISDDTMKRSAEIAQATDFIAGKEEQYESHIAQGGSNVSGGQKQRLSIARAIAKQPKIFLFDDSFSALDYKTDAALRHALAQNVGNATVLIVAQRISTILHADQIIVLNEGKIDGIGTHSELMESCKTYREIAESQLSEAELKGGSAS